MSGIKHKKIWISFIVVIFSLLLFGCENKIPVENIRFNDREIILLVGESYSPDVVVTPHYASDRGYQLTTNNSRVVTVNGGVITAVAEGSTTIRAVANDNSLLEDYISVQVRKHRTVLSVPKNLTYDRNNQTIKFDAVDNASSYTLRVGSNVIDIGNSTSYSLARYESEYGGAYDQVLDISIKANAATYSQAFINSDYSRTLSIYQNSPASNVQIVNGILTFDKVDSTDSYQVEVGGVVVYTGAFRPQYDLTAIDERLAGQELQVKVMAVADRTRFESLPEYSNIRFYDSLPITTNAIVMNVCDPAINNAMLSWDVVSHASSYNVVLDDEVIATVDDNFVDLSTLAVYDEIVRKVGYYTIHIDPIMDESKNVLKTSGVGTELYVNKLDAPNITAADNKIMWGTVDNAISYMLLVEGDETFSSNVTTKEFTLDNYPAGEYVIHIEAIGGILLVDDKVVHLLPSDIEDITVTKQTAVEDVCISEYKLTFSTIPGDRYILSGSVEDDFEADSTTKEITLFDKDFSAGNHVIYVTHMGDGETVFDSVVSSASFVQLSAIETITITTEKSDEGSPWLSIVSTDITDLPEGASIKFTLLDDAEARFDTNESVWYINNIDDEESETFLTAGEYTIELRVLGDGENTFSANRTGMTANATASVKIVVLPTPEITIVDRDNGELNIADVENAREYFILTVDEEYNITNDGGVRFQPEFVDNMAALLLQVVGDIDIDNNIAYIGSNLAQFNMYKLPDATLVYDKDTGVLTADYLLDPDSNIIDMVDHYELTLNGEPSDHKLGEAFSDFAIGDNVFEIKLIAKTELIEDAFYVINSGVSSLTVNKLDEDSTIYVNSDNQLVIIPNNQDAEVDLTVKITCGGSEFILESNGTKLENGTYALSYVYDSGAYYIDLLDELYAPIISELIDEFTVSVMYTSIDEDIYPSTYCDEITIRYADKVTLGRDGQMLTFTNLEPSRGLEDYLILINGEVKSLPDDTILDSDSQLISINVDSLDNDVDNSIRIITLNTDRSINNKLISAVGDECKYTFAPTLVLTSTKDNNAANNSVIISFEAEDKDYDPTYVLEIYTKFNEEIEEKDTPVSFTEDSIVDGKISYELDQSKLVGYGYIYVSAYVTTSYEHDGVYIFNSARSEELVFVKLDKVRNVRVDNGNLTFDAVENAIGYDVYQEEAGGYVKINTNLVKSTSYALAEQSGQVDIYVKAVSKVEHEGALLTNSNLSDSITIYKLETPEVSIVNGDLTIVISDTARKLLADKDADCTLMIKNGADEIAIAFDMDGIFVEENVITIEPSIVLNYGEDIILETITIQLVVNYTEGEPDPEPGVEPEEPGVEPVDEPASKTVYYANSNSVTLQVKGLLAPKNVIKTSAVNEDGKEIIEHIFWDANAKNIINGNYVLMGYVVRFEYIDLAGNSSVYYSNDSRLMYLDGENHKSYDAVLEGNKILFPDGFDSSGDGVIVANERFVAGKFKISVKSVPIVLSGETLVCSRYSTQYVVDILAQPELTTERGAVRWAHSPSVTNYLVNVYSSEDYATIIYTTTVTSNKYDFADFVLEIEGYNVYGLFGVTIRAQSVKQNVISSEDSSMMKVYRMNHNEVEVTVEDGTIILKANEFFEQAELEFLDENQQSQTLTYDRVDAAQIKMAEFPPSVDSWDKVSDLTVLEASVDHFIEIDGREILPLLSGKAYTLKVKLIGNSNRNLPIISSEKKFIEKQSFVKLESKATEISKGVVQFSTNYSGDSINYNFNGVTKIIDYGDPIPDYWEGVYIYEVNIITGTDLHTIYCVDYYSLSTMDSVAINYEELPEEEKVNNLWGWVKYRYIPESGGHKELVFNVFENNQIDFTAGTIQYYPIDRAKEDGGIRYTQGVGKPEDGNRNTINLSGGSFIYSVTLLGGDARAFGEGDDENTLSYLSANSTDAGCVHVYLPNILDTKDGKVLLGNQTFFDEDGNVLDSPVYQLEVKRIGGTGGDEFVTYIFVYHDGNDIDTVKKITDYADGIYVKAEGDDEHVLLDLTRYCGEGSYSVTVKTLAGMVEDAGGDNFISSTVSSPQTYKKVEDVNFNMTDGVITFAQSRIVNDLGADPTYITHYEITISDTSDGSEFCYIINTSSQGVKLDENKHAISYTVPKIITKKITVVGPDDEEVEEEIVFTLDPVKQYTIKIRASSVAPFVLDGTYKTYVDNTGAEKDVVMNVKISDGLEYAYIQDGILKWKVNSLAQYSTVIIKISYDGKTMIVNPEKKQVGSGDGYQYHYYEFVDSPSYIVEGLNMHEYIDSGKNYTISVSVQGTSNDMSDPKYVSILNSDPIIIEPVSRISRIQSTDIISIDGQIAWPVDMTAKGYVVKLSGTASYTFTIQESQLPEIQVDDWYVLNLTTTDENGNQVPRLDDGGNYVKAGSYTVTIRVLGDDLISSRMSDPSDTFIKPNAITGIAPPTGGSRLVTWNAVEHVSKYEVYFAYGEGMNNQTEVIEVEDNAAIMPDDVVGAWTIYIRAISTGIVKNNMILNSDWFYEEFSDLNAAPKPVLEFGKYMVGGEHLGYMWQVDETDFRSNTDSMKVSYRYYPYEYSNNNLIPKSDYVEETSYEISETIDAEGKTWYYFCPIEMGLYEIFKVEIERVGTNGAIASSPVTQDASLDLRTYATGDGSEIKPYTILEARHLMNIKHNPGANYQLIGNIDMSDVDIATIISGQNYIICDTFSGKLDGSNGANNVWRIHGFSGEYNNPTGFALFGTLRGAEITNVGLGDTQNQTNISNSFAKSPSDVLKLSLLAGTSIYTKIEGVVANKIVMQILVPNNRVSIGKDTYIAGLVAEATDTDVINCMVDLTVEFGASGASAPNMQSEAYIGAIFGQATKSTITTNNNTETASLVVSQLGASQSCYIQYMGGLVGHIDNSGINNDGIIDDGITGVTVSAVYNNIRAAYLGGIAGYMQKTTITSSNVEINIDNKNTTDTSNNDISWDTRIGGVAGMMKDSTIDTTESDMQIVVEKYSSGKTIYIGAYVGDIASDTNKSIVRYYDLNIEKTSISGNVANLGVYGNKPNSSNIEINKISR